MSTLDTGVYPAQSTYFCVTDYNDLPPAFNQTLLKYLCFQREACPTTNRLHWQVFLCFKTKQRQREAEKKYLSLICSGQIPVQLRPMYKNSSPSLCIQYCSKTESAVPNTFQEYGERPAGQGTRNDLVSACQLINNGVSINNIILENPAHARHAKHLQTYSSAMLEVASKQMRTVQVHYLEGPPGTGKSYTALQLIGTTPYFKPTLPDNGTIWFDGYNGEPVLWLDDFKHTNYGMENIARLCDVYPLQLPVKGSFTYALWTAVIITSNHPLAQKEGSRKTPFQDRVTHHYIFNGQSNRTTTQYIMVPSELSLRQTQPLQITPVAIEQKSYNIEDKPSQMAGPPPSDHDGTESSYTEVDIEEYQQNQQMYGVTEDFPPYDDQSYHMHPPPQQSQQAISDYFRPQKTAAPPAFNQGNLAFHLRR